MRGYGADGSSGQRRRQRPCAGPRSKRPRSCWRWGQAMIIDVPGRRRQALTHGTGQGLTGKHDEGRGDQPAASSVVSAAAASTARRAFSRGSVNVHQTKHQVRR